MGQVQWSNHVRTLLDRTLVVGQGNGDGQARLVSDHTGSVPLAYQVFRQSDMTWTEPVYGAIAEANFYFARQR